MERRDSGKGVLGEGADPIMRDDDFTFRPSLHCSGSSELRGDTCYHVKRGDGKPSRLSLAVSSALRAYKATGAVFIYDDEPTVYNKNHTLSRS